MTSKIWQAKADIVMHQRALDWEAQRVMTPLREALKDAVVEAYLEGANISELCRQYETSARVTIIDILKERGVYKQSTFPRSR